MGCGSGRIWPDPPEIPKHWLCESVRQSTFNTVPIAFSRWQMVDYTTTKHRGEGGSACGVRALQRHDQATGGIMGLLPLLLSSTERSNDEGSKNKRHTTTYGSPTLSLGRRTWHPWHSCPFSFVEMSTLNACTLDLGFWDETPSREGQLSGYVCSSSQNAQTHPCYIRGFLKCRRDVYSTEWAIRPHPVSFYFG